MKLSSVPKVVRFNIGPCDKKNCENVKIVQCNELHSEANIGEACKTTVKKYIVLHDTTNRQQYFAKTQVQNRPDNLEFKHDMFWSFNIRIKKFSRENPEVSQFKS